LDDSSDYSNNHCVDYRIDELSARSGVRIDTIRFYQGKGLLPPPRRDGRIAIYSEEHLDRLRRIRRLLADGLSLQLIRRVLIRYDLRRSFLTVRGRIEVRLTDHGAAIEILPPPGATPASASIPASLIEGLERADTWLGEGMPGPGRKPRG